MVELKLKNIKNIFFQKWIQRTTTMDIGGKNFCDQPSNDPIKKDD